MEFRSQKTVIGLIAASWLLPVPAAGQELPFEVRHNHWRKGCSGILVLEEDRVTFREINPKEKKEEDLHSWNFSYDDVQQLSLTPRRITVLTYQDNKWKLGSDRALEFEMPDKADMEAAARYLRQRLDRRLVAALPMVDDVEPIWEIPVKHLKRISGSEGTLIAGKSGMAYKTRRPGESRTWSYKDIESISSSGPFQLTITTFERARSHYGDRKGFNFRLKQALEEERYIKLWRRLHSTNNFSILSFITKTEETR